MQLSEGSFVIAQHIDWHNHSNRVNFVLVCKSIPFQYFSCCCCRCQPKAMKNWHYINVHIKCCCCFCCCYHTFLVWLRICMYACMYVREFTLICLSFLCFFVSSSFLYTTIFPCMSVRCVILIDLGFHFVSFFLILFFTVLFRI